MKIVKLDDATVPASYDELVEILEGDGIICFPADNNYRLGVSALSPKAVNALVAAKRRAKHAPSLVFVSGSEMLEQVAAEVPEVGRTLANEFWPGPLTLLVEPSDIFPSKVRKTLKKATGLIGVRIPGHPVARGLIERFNKPLLVSSANIAKKSGASSPAQVRKNFGRQVEAMIDFGDIPQTAPSTLVGISGNVVQIRRPGAVTEEQIRAVAKLA